jgi:hypothetical protein
MADFDGINEINEMGDDEGIKGRKRSFPHSKI